MRMQLAPKNRTFCTTCSLHDRLALVAILDSCGYCEGLLRVINKMTGVGQLMSNRSLPRVTAQWMELVDGRKKYERQYRQKTTTKSRRAKKTKNKIRAGIAKDKRARTQGHFYGTGIAVVDDNAATTTTATAPAKKKSTKNTNKAKLFCNACGQYGHARRTNKLCAKYKPPQKKVQKGPK